MDATALLIKQVLFPAWARKNGSPRLRYVEQLERTQWMSKGAHEEAQWLQFKTLLQHAFDHCAFYQRKMSAAGIVPADITTPDEIASLPTTSKQDIQEWRDDLIADDYRDRPLLKDMTGGSTGSPMTFFYDEDRLDSRVAATIRHNRWIGWDIGEQMAVLWGAPRDLASAPLKARVRDWILDRRLWLDASALDAPRMHAFHRQLLTHRPKFVLAYANTLALFAKYLVDAGLQPYRPRAIICSGEVLTEESRLLIESTFGCRVFNRYGSREFAVIASECASHRGMHINAENLLVEVIAGEPRSGEPGGGREAAAGVGPTGEIVITDLKNFAMPMIRYRTRDVGAMMTAVCTCGRGLPLMDLKGGRVTDFLTGMDGQKVSGIVLATYVITNLPGIRQVQFVQDRADGVRVRVVRDAGWSDESARELALRIRAFLGAGMAVDVEFVEDIPLEASGKYRFSINTQASA